MAGNCDATNGAGRSNAPMPGSVSSAACWFATNICLPFTVPFSISPVSGSPYENVFETRLIFVAQTHAHTNQIAFALRFLDDCHRSGSRQSLDGEQVGPLVRVWSEIGIEENAVTLFPRAKLKRKGD